MKSLKDYDFTKGVTYTHEFVDSDMTDDERLFVGGLVRYFKPRNILEVGVAAGGNSFNILKNIDDMDSVLYSIDVVETFKHPFLGPLKIGKYVFEEMPDYPKDKWKLFLGKDPSEVIESIGEKYDMLVLDTAHVHPIETLNFLSVLPFMNDGAIVVLHDVSLFMDELGRCQKARCLATRILMSAVCAEKITPDINGFGGFTNIVAFQIDENTRKYVRGIFDAFALPWECMPSVESVRKLCEKYYSEECMKLFDTAVTMNKKIYEVTHNDADVDITQDVLFTLNKHSDITKKISDELICDNKKVAIYGYGVVGKLLLSVLRENGVNVKFIIDRGVSSDCDLDIYGVDAELPECDLIVISSCKYEDEMKRELENNNISVKTLTVREILGM